jgi:hypothetical protein
MNSEALPYASILPRSALALFAAILLAPLALAQDTTVPTVKITAPKRSASAPGGTSTVTVRGTAKDDTGVARVAVEVPGVTTVDATLTPGTDPLQVTWEAVVPAQLGANTVKATAYDATPNASLTRTAKFTFSKICNLTISTGAGSGTITRRSGNNKVGKKLRITARPAAGFLFEKWTLDGADIATTRTIDFIVPDAAAATLAASFVANPYAGLSGLFNDILRTTGGEASGYYLLKLGANGSFTITASGPGISVSKKGFIELDGKAHFSIPRRGKMPITLDVVADLVLGGAKITLRDEQTAIDYTASSVRYANADTLPAAATMVFSPGAGIAAAIDGSGYATLRRSATGNCKVDFVLADGTVISFTAFPMQNSGAVIPIFKRLKPGGLLEGALHFTGTNNTQLDGSLHWVSLGQVRRSLPAFDGTLNTRGAAYTKPATGQFVFPLGPSGHGGFTLPPVRPLTALTFNASHVATFDLGPKIPPLSQAFVPNGTAIRGSTVQTTIRLPAVPVAPAAGILPLSVSINGNLFATDITHPLANTVICKFFIPAGYPTGQYNVNVFFNVIQNYSFIGGLKIIEAPHNLGRVTINAGTGLFSFTFPDTANRTVRTGKGAIVQTVLNGSPDYGLAEGFSLNQTSSDVVSLYLYTSP